MPPMTAQATGRGYAGYPVLAVMMKEGRLPDRELAEKLSGVDWNTSTRSISDYRAAADEAFEAAGFTRQKRRPGSSGCREHPKDALPAPTPDQAQDRPAKG